ncbi:MAG: hypothetical protein HYZ81_10030, partial [Nitrospinae bacterium]|nr:hypothetical protein [Nitrospinota bacterium]
MLAVVVTYGEREARNAQGGSDREALRQGFIRDLRWVSRLGKCCLWLGLMVLLTACDALPWWQSAPNPQASPEVSASLLAAGYARGIYRSTNGGKTWTPLGLEGVEISHYFKVLALSAGSPPTLYVGTTGQGLYQITLDAEQGPVALQRLKGMNIKAILPEPTDPNQLYAGTWGQGVMWSRDGGQTWESGTEGLTYPYVRAFARAPTTPTTFYAGTVGGVVRRREG